MKTVYQMLMAGDAAPLSCLYEIWNVKPPRRDEMREKALKTLSEAMLDPANVDRVWSMLSDKERGALQMLLAAHGGSKMLENMFKALHGGIRDMGEGQAEREKPHLEPKSVTEALYYRGLIARTFDMASSGAAQRLVYVPTDLIGLLVGMKTSYHDLPAETDDAIPVEEADESDDPLAVEVLPDMQPIHAADTSLVDDMTTLLAYIQIQSPKITFRENETEILESGMLDTVDSEKLRPHLVHDNPARFTFLFQLAAAADLTVMQEGQIALKRAEARRWLGLSRSEQVKSLAEAWKNSRALLDLAGVPGLRVNRKAGSMPTSNPATGRAAALRLLGEHVPRDNWWDIDSFIHVVRATDFPYLRPNADFSTWYIQNDSGTVMMGESYWDEIDGALLEYLIAGPLHWLGLIDLGEDAARLSAYGRGMLGLTAFPNPADPAEKIALQPDGSLAISRRISRLDRFTAARFAAWIAPANLSANTPYTYKLTMASLRRANDDGINAAQIAAFLTRTSDSGSTLPAPIVKLLDSVQLAPVLNATMERVVVLRTTTKEALDHFYDTPELRRFFGARLGDLAAVVRADHLQEAQDTLYAHGVKVDWIGG